MPVIVVYCPRCCGLLCVVCCVLFLSFVRCVLFVVCWFCRLCVDVCCCGVFACLLVVVVG